MTGTRLRLFPQYAEGYPEPEVVELSVPAGTVGPGPADRRLIAINPFDKGVPYDPPSYMPPYQGPCFPPAMPSRSGHFDHLPVGTPEFQAAHLYGCVRRTLDVWEAYLGRKVIWWSAELFPQLELVPLVQWDNAQSGPGFIETGLKLDPLGEAHLFCLNFDIVSHETGHAILFSEVGVPAAEHISAEYLAFQEGFSDLGALVAALHFQSVVERLLDQTDGNLYVLNLVSRFGEVSDLDQIRISDNNVTMADVAGLRLTADGNWIDPEGLNRNQHHLAQPLIGAVFDVLVDIYQNELVARGVIPPDLDARGWTREEVDASFAALHRLSARALAAFRPAFRRSLAAARDLVGICMAHVIRTIGPYNLTFDRVAALMIEAATAQGLGYMRDALIENFLWRGIDPRPVLRASRQPMTDWRRLPIAERLRRVKAAERARRGRQRERTSSDLDDFLQARRLMPHTHRAL